MNHDMKVLYESNLSIKDAFKVVQKSDDRVLSKTKYYGLTQEEKREENKKVLEHSEELIILSLFAIFERKIRNILLENVSNLDFSNSNEFKDRFSSIIKDKVEFLEIYKLLKMFDFLSEIEHSRIKQIAEYRNWIAHGKNQNKLPSNTSLIPKLVFEELDMYILNLEKVFS
jgi:hypothetical protein